MESRKLQKVGRSTVTVSLPNKWIKENGIKPGDLVFIISEKDGTLRIIPSQSMRQEEIEEEYVINVDACDERGILERIIVGGYILGRNVIRIVSSNRIEKAHVDEVRRIIRKLIGLGILEETANSILLQCSLDPSRFKIDMLIRRLSLIVSTILFESMQALLENNETLAREAIEREDEADAIYYLATRLLLYAQRKLEVAEQMGITDILFMPAIRLILQSLELIGDYSEDIARKVLALKIYRDKVREDITKKIYELGEAVRTVFQKAVDCIFTGDVKLANNVLEMKNSLEIGAERFMYEMPEIPYLRAIVSGLANISNVGAIIANIAINKALQEHSKHIEEIVKIVKHITPQPRSVKIERSK
ncbi:MAG: phosphate uptake regulator PhoU [Candidatus Bathyarchaeia archaeon]